MTALFVILLSLRMLVIPCQIVTVSVSSYWDGSGAPPYQGLTASGVQTGPQTCACGPRYPFGTVFIVDGVVYVCQDRGSAITDGHLDLWMTSEEAAIKWGRQTLAAIVVTEEER